MVAGDIDDDLLTTLTEDEDGHERARGAWAGWKGLLRSGKEAKTTGPRRHVLPRYWSSAESRAIIGVGEPLLPVTTAKGTTTWAGAGHKEGQGRWGLTAVWPIRR